MRLQLIIAFVIVIGLQNSSNKSFCSPQDLDTADIILTEDNSKTSNYSNDSMGLLRVYNTRIDSIYTNIEFKVAKQLSDSVEHFALLVNDNAEKARYFHLRGNIHHVLGDLNLAEYYFDQSVSIYRERGLHDSVALVLLDAAENYRYLADYEQGLIEAYNALNYFGKTNDSSMILQAKEVVGKLHVDNNDYDTGLKYMLENLDHYLLARDSVEIGQSLNNVGMVYNMYRKVDSAIYYLNESLKIRKLTSDSLGITENYAGLSNCYYSQGKWEMSLTYANRALEYLLRNDEVKYVHFILRNIANIKFNQGLLHEAQDYYTRSYDISREYNRKEAGWLFYSDLSDIEKEKQNFAKALEYYKISRKYQDSITKEKKSREVSELEVRYQTERKDKLLQAGRHRIERLEKEKLLSRTRNAFLVISISLVLLVIVVVINRQRIKQKQDLIIIRKEEELTRMKLDHANKTIEVNNLKLREFTDNLIEKTQLIEYLEEKLEQATDLSDEQNSIRIQKQEELLKLKILTEEDWIRFKLLFNEVHQGFLSSITELHPNLTEGEKRYIILLKLGVNPKEMASILGISPAGVYACKYRLKKKLHSGENKNIDDVLTALN